jgi:hypothetical protein
MPAGGGGEPEPKGPQNPCLAFWTCRSSNDLELKRSALSAGGQRAALPTAEATRIGMRSP